LFTHKIMNNNMINTIQQQQLNLYRIEMMLAN